MSVDAPSGLGGEEPLVSVAIAAYNAERFIGATLASVLAQSYRNIEVIVLDDGSTDRTGEIVLGHAARDARVKLFRQANAGPSAARNAALERARGEYVALIDADDLWHPDKLRKQVAVLRRGGPEVGLVYCWSVYIDEAGTPTGNYAANCEVGDVYLKLLLYNFIGCGSTPLIRRSCIERCGTFRDEYTGLEDKELLMRIAEHYRFAVVPEFLVGYRIMGGTTSHAYRQIETCYRRLLLEVRGRHPEIPEIVYRWSRGMFYSFIASRSRRAGRLADTARHLALALINDPLPLIRIARGSRRDRHGAAPPADAAPFAVAAGTVRDTSPLAPRRRRRLEEIEAARATSAER